MLPRKCLLCWLLFTLLLASISALAKESMLLVGEAKMRVFFMDIYNSYLYTRTGEYRKESLPVVLKIEYLRQIKAKHLVRRTEQEWRHLGLDDQKTRRWVTEIESLWPDVGRGDILAIEVTSSKSSFYLNEELLGHIEDPRFGQSFLAIWLSKNTSQPGHRNQLLGISK